MSYSSPGTKFKGFEELSAVLAGLITVAASDTQANPKFIAKWQFVRQAGFLEQPIFRPIISMYAEIRRTSGASFVNAGWYRSVDGVAWTTFVIQSHNTNVFNAEFDKQVGANDLGLGNAFIGFGVSNTDGATAGEVQRAKGSLFVDLPPGVTAVQLL